MKLIKILFISITVMLLSVGCLYAADNSTDYENNTQANTQDLNVMENEILSENTNEIINDTNDLNATGNMTISETVNNNLENTSAFIGVENGTYFDSLKTLNITVM